MKIAEQPFNEARHQHIEAIVARHVDELFHRLPMLSGFWLHTDREVAKLSLVTWPGWGVFQEVYEEVMQSLVELADERPEAVQLMRGRTFARTLH